MGIMANDRVNYFLLSETVVDEDLALKHDKIISENIVTSPTGSKIFTITFQQVLQSFGNLNWNGRIYDDDTVMSGIRRNPLIQHDIKMNTWTGEHGHPNLASVKNSLQRQMTIDPYMACWTIAAPRVVGNLLVAECTTLAGGQGDVLRDRALTKFPPMASSRAVGGVDGNGKVIKSSYNLITFDAVIRPSHKEAYADMNTLNVGATSNMMVESALKYDLSKDSSFADFIMSESSSKYQIEMLCNTFKLDYDSMSISNGKVTFISETAHGKNTIIIPLNKLIQAEYHNLF